MFKAANLNIHVVFFTLFMLAVFSPPVAYEHFNIVMVVVTLASVLLL